MTIQDKIKALQYFQDNAERIVIDQVRKHEATVIDLNTDEQLLKGQDSTGRPITPGYRPLTVQIKRLKGQPTDRVTLKDEGDFHQSFRVVYGSNYFALTATDPKTQKLERKYGKEIFGLDNTSLQEIIEEVKPDLINEFRKIVG